MEVGQNIYGFLIKEITEVPEAGGTFYEMEHEKTGAKLGWMRTEDENKTFSISFKTIPEDHTGVFHILEHSVLQGSGKYPMKAPFVELMKGSLNTFLNAMTFPDKTMYPFSSRNAKDFENLMRVYLDAVFHPCLYQNENIFLQEGWHYEAEAEGMQPFYNGVVLNEMRGANASVDSLIYNEIQSTLFPDNCYQYASGGKPDAIIDLTYENYKMTHSRFYHPSNAFLILDGKVDIKKTLQVIHEYLSEFERKECEFPIPVQKSRGLRKRKCAYAVETEEKNQGYLAFGYVVGMFSDVKKILATKILIDYLVASNESPLKKAILSGGYGYDVTVQFADGMLQPFFTLIVRNIECNKQQEIETLITNTLLKVKREGMDKEQLEALLSQLEFSSRERDFGGYPIGLINAMSIMESWLYGGRPTAKMEENQYFEEFREEILTGEFEKYLDEIFLQNNSRAIVLMVPSTTCLQEEQEKEQARLTEFYESCGKEERKALWKKQVNLKAWQATPNTAEEISTLPGLSLLDIGEEPIKFPTKRLADGTLWHHASTKGIKYLRIFFPMENYSAEEISMSSFLCGVLGDIPLTDLPKEKLDMEKRRIFGQLQQYLEINSKFEDVEYVSVHYVLDVNYLENKEEEALELLKRIVNNSDFVAEEMIGEYLHQQLETYQQAFLMNGQQMAMMKAKASSSEKAKLVELMDGPAYYEWLKKAVIFFEGNPQEFVQRLAMLAREILVSDYLWVSMTAGTEEIEYCERIRQLFPKRENKEQKVSVHKEKQREKVGFVIPASVAYSAKAANLNQMGIANSGKWMVFSKIASMDYLWNEVRVLGGAYGTGMSVGIDGSVEYFSYRDPNPSHSLDVFDKVGDFIKQYAGRNQDITRLIIGTISDTEFLYTPRSMGRISDEWYISGITDEIRRERRKQILTTKITELIKMANDLNQLVPMMDCCVVASQELLENARDKIVNVKSI